MFFRISLRGIILLDEDELQMTVEVEVEGAMEVEEGGDADTLSACPALSDSLFIAGAESTTVTLPLVDAE